MQKDIDNVYSVKSSKTKVFHGQKRHQKAPVTQSKVILEQWVMHLLNVYRHKHTVNEQSS